MFKVFGGRVGWEQVLEPNEVTFAYMADKRHNDVYTVVDRDCEFTGFKVACLSGFFRAGWHQRPLKLATG
jgi:hypothetical protein